MLPFIVAWFVLAPLLGVYRPSWTLAKVALIWLVCGSLALAARSIMFDRALLNAFFPIALIGNGLFLLAARALYRLLSKDNRPPHPRQPAAGPVRP